ncbi:MAG: heavy-metal-associated domain-containing protein [Methyloglobulus sp.]
MESATLTVNGMKCGGCENIVIAKLESLDGVKSVSASSADKAVKVEFDAGKTNLQGIAQAIKEAGYSVIED